MKAVMLDDVTLCLLTNMHCRFPLLGERIKVRAQMPVNNADSPVLPKPGQAFGNAGPSATRK